MWMLFELCPVPEIKVFLSLSFAAPQYGIPEDVNTPDIRFAHTHMQFVSRMARVVQMLPAKIYLK